MMIFLQFFAQLAIVSAARHFNSSLESLNKSTNVFIPSRSAIALRI